jgi:LysM repeat protein
MSATITALVPSTSRAATVSTSGPVPTNVPTHLRITRRGRLVLTLAVVVAALALIAGFLLTGGSAVATSSAGNVHFDHVTVAAGETLWQVAEGVAPGSDPRDVISDIVKLNDLSSTQVMPGQSLAIPVQYSQS